jgi:hypothetical protein
MKKKRGENFILITSLADVKRGCRGREVAGGLRSKYGSHVHSLEF